jgi:mannose-6-phosphate isomerase
MSPAYLIRTEPAFRDYLWGGRKLEQVLGKALPPSGVWAESWEVVDHDEHQSVVKNGPMAGKTLREVAHEDPQWLFGTNSQLKQLPLLLKYLDCQRVLSVQVHPDDNYAQKMTPPDLGKTEAWYIIAAEPGAVLYAGLKAGVGKKELASAIASGRVEDCLHKIEPQAGDCVFIPAGTVHALGAGLLVAEIQQASNTTFRLFDWNRVDADGKPRTLHIESSLAVIDYSSGPRPLQIPQPTSQPQRERLVACEKFILDRITPPSPSSSGCSTLCGDGKFHLLTAPHGSVQFEVNGETVSLQAGESVMAPASLPAIQATVQGAGVLLDMYLP